ncbi:MAG TPA: phospholipase D-like domain-containing protein [Acetobacteraceae bacterium]|nr:phospholipase D-like domain-containing protein [Acetobacteraceae bacterium]
MGKEIAAGAAALALTLLDGCATLPNVAPEIEQAAAQRSADPRQEIALFQSWGEHIAGRPFIAGNNVTIKRNGRQALPALAATIGAARTRIDMESYEFDEDEGARFGALLLQKRRDGLQVHLIYDGWGALGSAALVQKLRTSGVTVLNYNPLGLNPRVPIDLNDRDHRKLLVTDGAVAVTGGINITRVNTNRKQPGVTDPDEMAWRDTDVVVQGPAVAEFQRLFLQTWQLQHGPPLPPPPATPQTPRGEALVQAIDGTPAAGRPDIYRSLLVAITLAERTVHLTTGFFVPPPDLSGVLQDAARRGVEVSLVLPGHSDSPFALAAGRDTYGPLLHAGVHIYERKGVVLHAKTAVIDGVWSAVGSSNLDWRSVLFNSEIDAVILDRDFGKEMEAMFADDVAQSRIIDPAAWARRGVGERLWEWSASLWSRLL